MNARMRAAPSDTFRFCSRGEGDTLFSGVRGAKRRDARAGMRYMWPSADVVPLSLPPSTRPLASSPHSLAFLTLQESVAMYEVSKRQQMTDGRSRATRHEQTPWQ